MHEPRSNSVNVKLVHDKNIWAYFANEFFILIQIPYIVVNFLVIISHGSHTTAGHLSYLVQNVVVLLYQNIGKSKID